MPCDLNEEEVNRLFELNYSYVGASVYYVHTCKCLNVFIREFNTVLIVYLTNIFYGNINTLNTYN